MTGYISLDIHLITKGL